MPLLPKYSPLYLTLLVVVVLGIPQLASANGVNEFLYNTVVIGGFGFFLGIGAGVLNYGINTFVVNFGTVFITSGIGLAIDGIWVFMRDLFNLTFIFGLVYIGFKMILNSNDSQSKKWLANIIIAALLVNFSLFFTKAVVDISNYVATELLNAGIGEELIELETGTAPDQPAAIDVAASMKSQMKLMTAIGGTGEESVSSVIAEKTEERAEIGWGLILGTAILFMVATFIFFSTGLLFIIRGMVLLLYMAFSPFLFIGMIFPTLQGEATKHVKKFIGRALFAPVYAALLFVVLALINAIVGPGNVINYGTALMQKDGHSMTEFGATFGLFILICALLIATLQIGKQMGVAGAEAALKTGTSLRKFGQRQLGSATFGMGARIGRNTIGAGANAAYDSDTMRRLSARSGMSGFAARQVAKGLKGTGDYSFDGRNINGLGKSTGLGAGKKGGYATRQKEDQKKKEEMMDYISTRDMEDPKNIAAKKKLEDEIDRRISVMEKLSAMDTATLERELATQKLGLEAEMNKLVQGRDIQKNMTPEDIRKQESEIAQRKAVLDQTNAVYSLKKAIDGNIESIGKLKDKEKTLPIGSSEAAAVRAQWQQEEAVMKQHESSLGSMVENLNARKKLAGREIKYQDQKMYLETLKSGQKFKQDVASVLSGAAMVRWVATAGRRNRKSGPAAAGMIGGMGAGVAAGSAALGSTAATTIGAGAMVTTVGVGAVVQGMAKLDGDTIAGLEKKYGANYEMMSKKENEEKEVRDLKKALKKLTEDDKKADKEEEKS